MAGSPPPKKPGPKETREDLKTKQIYSVDAATSAGIPSVTKLLQRKRLPPSPPTSTPSPPPPPKAPAAAAAPPPAPEPKPAESTHDEGISIDISAEPTGVQIESSGPTIQKSSSSPPQPAAPMKIQPGARRSQASASLAKWELEQLKNSQDPLAQGLLLAFTNKDLLGALFLSNSGAASPQNSSVPLFQSTAVIKAEGKTGVWTGMKWDPAMVTDTWEQLLKLGQVELSPPGSFTHVASQRNITRAAFGIQLKEYLTLVRAGSPEACRGVVAFVSNASIVADLTKALPLIGTPFSD